MSIQRSRTPLAQESGMMEILDESEGPTMRMACRLTTVAMTVVLATATGAAQTVSQRCADAVRHANPDLGRVWVVTALSRGDQSVLNWQSASGQVGTCTMNAAGEIVDVKTTGRREPPCAPPLIGPVEAPEQFEPYLMRCESADGGRVECDVRPFAAVTLVAVDGDAECVMNTSWGHEGAVVWVDAGCRATFDVRPRRIPVPAPHGADLRDRVGEPELRTLKGRAQDACLRAARGQGIAVTEVFGTRAEGSYVVVLMAVESWAQRGEVTCRYDPANDRAAIAR